MFYIEFVHQLSRLSTFVVGMACNMFFFLTVQTVDIVSTKTGERKVKKKKQPKQSNFRQTRLTIKCPISALAVVFGVRLSAFFFVRVYVYKRLVNHGKKQHARTVFHLLRANCALWFVKEFQQCSRCCCHRYFTVRCFCCCFFYLVIENFRDILCTFVRILIRIYI